MKLIPWKGKRELEASRPADPFIRLRQEMDDLLGRFWREPFGDAWNRMSEMSAGPRMDIAESEDEITLHFELPGIKPEEVEISVSGDTLSIQGEKSETTEEKRGECTYSERSYGRFARSVRLPAGVDSEKVDANYRDGVLSVTLSKLPGEKPRKITVRRP
ncbi:MAG: Hsp20/alpha crystallin family protein [Planctomycetes bacterium]|nr:Hsp20/alpha crystallin family protein [Planctomycetota bacterium]